MELEVGALTGAADGEKNPYRLTQRNGCRGRDWETRAGTVELRIPKLRMGSCFRGFFARRTSPALRDRQSLADTQRNWVVLAEDLPFAGFDAFCEAHCGHPAHSPGKSANYGEGHTPEKKSRWHGSGMRSAGTVNSLITKTK